MPSTAGSGAVTMNNHRLMTIAVTSLYFIDDPVLALREMWRMPRHALALGLLHRTAAGGNRRGN